MIRKYVMFSYEVDKKLIDLGFELKYMDRKIYYENIYEGNRVNIDALVIHITKERVYVESLCSTMSVNYRTIFRDLNGITLKEIIDKLDECIKEVEETYKLKGEC